MSISVKCQHCGRGYKVSDQAAGKRFKCKQCESPVRVPVKKRRDDEFPNASDAGIGNLGESVSALPPKVHPKAKPKRRKQQRRPEPAWAFGHLHPAILPLALLGGIPLSFALLAGVALSLRAANAAPLAACLFVGAFFATLLIAMGGVWRVFEKAGQPGWASLVPLVNIIVLHEIAGVPKWYILLWFIPCFNIICVLILYIGVARNFGQDVLFGIGLFFMGFIFFPLLGFGEYEYEGNWEF